MKNRKLFGLQLFAEAVAGKKIVYLYRILSTEKDHDAKTLAFTTENERTKSKDADTTATKDGTVRTPGTAEVEITASSLLKKGDKFIDELEAALDDDEKMEIWEVNLAEPQESSSNKFKAKYFQGYLTEIDKTSNAEDNVELSLTFGLEGKGVDGYTIYIPVEVDGRQVAKATAKYTKEEIEQQQKRDLRKKGMR